MIEYLARRVLYALVTLLGITLIIFLLIHVAPGDPAIYYASAVRGTANVSPAVMKEVRRVHHLDEPLLIQYGYWLWASSRLDFGMSISNRRPVMERVAEKLPNTLMLNGVAFLLALTVGVPLGLLTAARSSGLVDRFSGPVLLLLYSLPTYWVALMLMQLFSMKLGLLPLYGMVSEAHAQMGPVGRLSDRVLHMVLPVLTLAYGQLAVLGRFSRAAILDVIGKEFVVTARAKGLNEQRILLRHVFRNALIPLITLVGLMVPYVLSGGVIVESVFAWDGLGRLFYDSVLSRDYPTVMALSTLGAMATLFSYLMTDLLYTLADPRIRVGAGLA